MTRPLVAVSMVAASCACVRTAVQVETSGAGATETRVGPVLELSPRPRATVRPAGEGIDVAIVADVVCETREVERVDRVRVERTTGETGSLVFGWVLVGAGAAIAGHAAATDRTAQSRKERFETGFALAVVGTSIVLLTRSLDRTTRTPLPVEVRESAGPPVVCGAAPVAGARVSLRSGGRLHERTTDASGRARFDDVPPGADGAQVFVEDEPTTRVDRPR